MYDCWYPLDFGIFIAVKEKYHLARAAVWDGTVAWLNEQDIYPHTLYVDSVRVAE